MNTELNQGEPLLKERSYVKSIAAGMRLPLRHPWGFLRHLWPLLLVNVIVWALISKPVSAAVWTFYVQAVAPGVLPTELISSFLTMSLFGALAMVLLGAWAGQVVYLMKRYEELNYLPAVQPWKLWRDIYPDVLRGVALCVVGYAVTVGLAVLSLFVMPGRVWAFTLFIALMLLWAIVYVPAGQHYMMGRSNPLAALAWPFRHFSSLGGSSAILIVCGMLLVTLLFIASLPTISAIYVNGLSDASVAMGDGTDIPSNFSVLRSICFGLTFMVAPIAWTFIFVPLCFHWGSLKFNEGQE